MNDTNITAQVTKDCVQSNSQFTGTEYYNICTHQQNFVPYGGLNYVGVGLFLFFLGICVVYIIKDLIN